MSQVCEVSSSCLSENVNSSTKSGGDYKQKDKDSILKAERQQIQIGAQYQVQFMKRDSYAQSRQLHKKQLQRLKVWDSSSTLDQKEYQETFKLLKRKIGRNAYNQEEFMLLVQRTNSDLKLIQELIHFDEKYLKKYFENRVSLNSAKE